MADYRYDIGFLGGGQLARMSIQAAQKMGLKCLSLDPSANSPASQIADHLVGKLDDVMLLGEICRSCQMVTLENEFIPAGDLKQALSMTGREDSCLLPSMESLATIQDKLIQREAYAKAGVPSPKAVALIGDGSEAIEEIGFPMVIKSRFGGYDGKGTRYAKTHEDLMNHHDLWAGGGWLAESFVPFVAELAVMAYRKGDQVGAFPTMESIQTNHVCDLVFPCAHDATQIALDAIAAVGGEGLYGVELFLLASGEVLVNEMAPRPHNSGHYTLDWGGLSQFDVHVRLVQGLEIPLLRGGDVCMANVLGIAGGRDYRPAMAKALSEVPDARFHWYGKTEVREGRKMGHINCVGSDSRAKAELARDAFYRAWQGA